MCQAQYLDQQYHGDDRQGSHLEGASSLATEIVNKIIIHREMCTRRSREGSVIVPTWGRPILNPVGGEVFRGGVWGDTCRMIVKSLTKRAGGSSRWRNQQVQRSWGREEIRHAGEGRGRGAW